MRQIEVVDLVWNHTGRGVVMWYCPLSPRWAGIVDLREVGVQLHQPVSRGGAILPFSWIRAFGRGWRVVRRGPLYSPHPTQKYTSSTSSMTLLLWSGEVPIELAAPPDSTGDKSEPQEHP